MLNRILQRLGLRRPSRYARFRKAGLRSAWIVPLALLGYRNRAQIGRFFRERFGRGRHRGELPSGGVSPTV